MGYLSQIIVSWYVGLETRFVGSKVVTRIQELKAEQLQLDMERLKIMLQHNIIRARELQAGSVQQVTTKRLQMNLQISSVRSLLGSTVKVVEPQQSQSSGRRRVENGLLIVGSSYRI
ncbi:hypothetical protein FGIG_08896 [Fasciola gigantica]|uniref:Uncharacterized protein n=1 Tax=Fasciola gigantica TaxID=46835 RepID=A0A504YXH5_FASGI|nr:hypothetical protein FGIG_08896 [Fasciola gigantica]